MSATLERLAWQAWADWGIWAKFTACKDCGEVLYCRARENRRYLCLECWDLRQS